MLAIRVTDFNLNSAFDSSGQFSSVFFYLFTDFFMDYIHFRQWIIDFPFVDTTRVSHHDRVGRVDIAFCSHFENKNAGSFSLFKNSRFHRFILRCPNPPTYLCNFSFRTDLKKYCTLLVPASKFLGGPLLVTNEIKWW